MSKAKKEKAVSGDTLSRLNRIHPVTNVLFNLMFLLVALACFLPIIFIFMISITDNNIIRTEGYKVFVTARTFSGWRPRFLAATRKACRARYASEAQMS